MKTLIGFGNLLLLAMNISALGTIAYKGKLWQPETLRQSSPASIEESLELSPDQAGKLTAERGAFLNNWEKIETELQASRTKLLEAIREENPDSAELWSLVDEITQLQSMIEKQAVEHLLQEKAILTPQQNERYFSQLEDRVRQTTGRMQRYRGGRSARQDSPAGRGAGRGSGKGLGKGPQGRP
jgi:Spy/CpxP family protein refolding chaperone